MIRGTNAQASSDDFLCHYCFVLRCMATPQQVAGYVPYLTPIAYPDLHTPLYFAPDTSNSVVALSA